MAAAILKVAGDHWHLQQIVAGLTEGVILLKSDWSICWANEAALAMHAVADVKEPGATAGDYRETFRLTYRNKQSLADGDYPADQVVAGEIFDEVVVEVSHAKKPKIVWVHQIPSLVLNDDDGVSKPVVLAARDCQ